MLTFLRKHQKIFFLFTTIVVIFSFTFFGTYSAFSTWETREDPVAFVTVGGKEIRQSDLLILHAIMAPQKEGYDLSMLDDSFFEKELFATGIAAAFAEKVMPLIRQDLMAKREKISQYKPYVHQQAPFLSATAIWRHFAPELVEVLEKAQSKEELSDRELFELLAKGYVAQEKFPAGFLRQVLSYQLQQYHWLPVDPVIKNGDLSFAGFRSARDWFGETFLEEISRFLLNASEVLKEEGTQVSSGEAKATLLHNVYANLKKRQAEESSWEEAEKLYDDLITLHRIDETQLLSLWSDLLSLRNRMRDVAALPLVDRWTGDQFIAFAEEGVDAELYSLPKELRSSHFFDMLQRQLYFELVGKDFSPFSTAVPVEFLSADKVAQKAPELACQSFRFSYRMIDKKLLSERIGIRQAWEWQLGTGWDLLRKKFPELSAAETKEERVRLLDALSQKKREELEIATRTILVEQHPEWVEELLTASEVQEKELDIRLKGGAISLLGIDKPRDFSLFLEGVLQGKKELYTQDGRYFYQVEAVSLVGERELLSMTDALADGTLTELLDERLRSFYQEYREKKPSFYKDETGQWQPFRKVREEIASVYYRPLLSALDDMIPALKVAGKEKTASWDRYAHYRFYPFMAIEREKKVGDLPIKALFELEYSDKRVERWDAKGSLLSLVEGDLLWSAVELGEEGNLFFAHTIPATLRVAEETSLGVREWLGSELQKELLATIFAKLEAKGGLAQKE